MTAAGSVRRGRSEVVERRWPRLSTATDMDVPMPIAIDVEHDTYAAQIVKEELVIPAQSRCPACQGQPSGSRGRG
jgi:hypothetical protein